MAPDPRAFLELATGGLNGNMIAKGLRELEQQSNQSRR